MTSAEQIQIADVVVRKLGDMIIDWWVTPQDGRKAEPFETQQPAFDRADELASASGGKVVEL